MHGSYEDIKAKEEAGSNVGFVILTSIACFTGYQWLSPNSATNSIKTSQEMAIEECSVGHRVIADHGFWARFSHTFGPAMPRAKLLATIKNDTVSLSWVTASEKLTGNSGSFYRDITRDSVNIVVLSLQNPEAPAYMQQGYYDSYKSGKSTTTDWHPVRNLSESQLPEYNRGQIRTIRSCAEKYMTLAR